MVSIRFIRVGRGSLLETRNSVHDMVRLTEGSLFRGSHGVTMFLVGRDREEEGFLTPLPGMHPKAFKPG